MLTWWVLDHLRKYSGQKSFSFCCLHHRNLFIYDGKLGPIICSQINHILTSCSFSMLSLVTSGGINRAPRSDLGQNILIIILDNTSDCSIWNNSKSAIVVWVVQGGSGFELIGKFTLFPTMLLNTRDLIFPSWYTLYLFIRTRWFWWGSNVLIFWIS